MGYGFHDFFLPDGLGIYHELQTKIVHVVFHESSHVHPFSPWLLDCFIIHFWSFHPCSSICSPSKIDMAWQNLWPFHPFSPMFYFPWTQHFLPIFTMIYLMVSSSIFYWFSSIFIFFFALNLAIFIHCHPFSMAFHLGMGQNPGT